MRNATAKTSSLKEVTIQDFGVTYDELEPFFDKAEKVFGTSGTAWSVNGKIVGKGKGGNFFAPDRSNPFPLPAQKRTYSARLYYKAAESAGFHPYDLPSANTSQTYTNTYAPDGAVQFLRLLQRVRLLHVLQGVSQCEHPARAAPGTGVRAAQRLLGSQGQPQQRQKTATGVTYVDSQATRSNSPRISSSFRLSSSITCT